MEQEIQALRKLADQFNPSQSSVNWSEVKYSIIVDGRIELLYSEFELETRKIQLVLVDKNPNFAVISHHND